jgi:hypothetical protein
MLSRLRQLLTGCTGLAGNFTGSQIDVGVAGQSSLYIFNCISDRVDQSRVDQTATAEVSWVASIGSAGCLKTSRSSFPLIFKDSAGNSYIMELDFTFDFAIPHSTKWT